MGKVGIQIDSDLYVRLHETMRRENKTVDEILDRYIPSRPVPMNTKKVEFLYRGGTYNITRMAKLVGCAPSYFSLAKNDPTKIEKVLARFADPGVLPPADRPSLARVIYEAYQARDRKVNTQRGRRLPPAQRVAPKPSRTQLSS